MTLGDLIDQLVAIRDGVAGVYDKTQVAYTDGAYSGDLEKIQITLDPRVAYGSVEVEATISILGTET